MKLSSFKVKFGLLILISLLLIGCTPQVYSTNTSLNTIPVKNPQVYVQVYNDTGINQSVNSAQVPVSTCWLDKYKGGHFFCAIGGYWNGFVKLNETYLSFGLIFTILFIIFLILLFKKIFNR